MTTICNLAITSPVTATIVPAVPGFGKPLAVTAQFRFASAGGGTNCQAWLQTTIDGTTWIDLASKTFTGSGVALINLSGLSTLAATAPTDGTMADASALQGVLADAYRVKVTSTGTFSAGTTLKVDLWGRR